QRSQVIGLLLFQLRISNSGSKRFNSTLIVAEVVGVNGISRSALIACSCSELRSSGSSLTDLANLSTRCRIDVNTSSRCDNPWVVAQRSGVNPGIEVSTSLSQSERLVNRVLSILSGKDINIIQIPVWVFFNLRRQTILLSITGKFQCIVVHSKCSDDNVIWIFSEGFLSKEVHGRDKKKARIDLCKKYEFLHGTRVV